MSLMLRVFCFLQEAIVTSEEIGKDYEHVEAQQKKFDDFEKVCGNDGIQFMCTVYPFFVATNHYACINRI